MSQEILDIPRLGCLNIHASLLPRYRGCSPIQHVIIDGEEETGITIMQVVEVLDAGDMYKKCEIEIDRDMTGGILHDKMAEAGAKLMVEVLRDLDNITPEKQDENLVTYAAKIDKEESRLDFDNDAVYLERKIRAFNPYPATYFEHKGERFKLLKCKVVENERGLKSGELYSDNKHLIIGCKTKALEVLSIQRQGKKAMSVEELLRGYKF